MDFCFRTNVDPARWFIENHEVRSTPQPLRQDDFLLVATAVLPRLPLYLRRPQAHFVGEFLGELRNLPRSLDAEARELLAVRQSDVVRHGHDQGEAVGAALFRDVANAVANG